MPSTICSTINLILNFSYRTSDPYGSCIVKDHSISNLEIYKKELEQDVSFGRKDASRLKKTTRLRSFLPGKAHMASLMIIYL